MFIFVCAPVVCKPIVIVMRPTQMSSSSSLQTIPQNTMNFIKTPGEKDPLRRIKKHGVVYQWKISTTKNTTSWKYQIFSLHMSDQNKRMK